MPPRRSLAARLARWADTKLNGRRAPMSFAAATTGRLGDDWMVQLLSADAEMRGSLGLLRARSRQQAQDNALIAGYVNTLVDGVLGPEGIGTRPMVRLGGPQGDLDTETNTTLSDAFAAWGDRSTCVADGQTCYTELQRLILRTWAVDGEVLMLRNRGAPNRYGYDVSLVDADYLDEHYNVPPGDGTNEIRMGVEIDGRGRPVAYHLWTRHPRDVFAGIRERVRVPADRIEHLYIQLRPGQTRGLPPITPVLLTCKLLDEFQIATLMQSRIAASEGGFFETDPNHYAPPEDAPDGTGPNALQLDLEPGLTRQLPPGLKYVSIDPKHPTNTYEPFTKALQRLIARGMATGMSYASLTGDLSETSYSSDRAGRLAERDGWKGVQRWFAQRILRTIWRDFVEMGTLTGALGVRSRDAARYLAHEFIYRAWDWVDPKKDLEAASIELDLLLTTKTRLAAERGRDFEAMLEERQREDALMEKYGVVPATPKKPKPSAAADDEEDAPRRARALRLTGGA